MDISSPEKLLIANRRRRLVELRVQGFTLEGCAEVISGEYELPNYTRSRAHDDFKAVLGQSNRLTSVEVAAHRKIEEMRLDLMFSKLLPAIKQGDIKAIEAGIKCSKAKAQLLGLDSAAALVIENSVALELNAVLNDLEQALSPESYAKILTVIATKTNSDDSDDDD